MRIFVGDVWSTHNAGDAAILEALLDGLRRLDPEARIQVGAHFPESCRGLPGVEVVPDVLAFDAAALDAQLAHRPGAEPRLDRLREALEGADLVVSTGGYFLNAWPGNPFAFVFLSRLLHFGWAHQAGVPVAVLGQSVGPFGDAALRTAARQGLDRVGLLTVRDVQSWSYLQTTGVAPAARLTADLAVGLEAAPEAEVAAAMERLALPRDALGISVRSFPGTPAGAFEAMARAADRAVEDHGVDVLLIGTTVPPTALGDGGAAERALGNDDRVALEEVRRHMRHADRAALCGETLPPRLLKGVLATCRGLVATRMHAAILASTAGVPTAGIAYEFKVEGWFDQLGLPDRVLPLAAMQEAPLGELVDRVLAEGPALREHLARALPEVEERAEENFRQLGALLDGRRPAAARARWQREALHYDVRHRRLERIAELVEESLASDAPGGPRRRRVLDVGCSAGTLGRMLSEGILYHGCDLSAEAVAAGGSDRLVVHDLAEGLPAFDGEPYDVIVASGILEYLEDVPALLAGIRERLAPGGRLVVSYFNMDHVSRRAGRPFRHPLWVNDWKPRELRALLAEAGFAIERSSWSTAGPGPAPDVQQEAEVVAREAGLALDEASRDDLCHTLIYRCAPCGETDAPVRSTPAAPASRIRSTPAAPAVSVVIPCHGRLDLLAPVLEGFEAERRTGAGRAADFELVLVDDGSPTPVATLLEERGRPGFVRLLAHERNRGRGAALNTGLDHARGELVIFCDSDIAPEPGFVAEHLAFHERHPSELASHLGDLVWGVEPGLFGALMGARANPRMQGVEGPVDWTRWYTDNWSFKRRLLDARGLRFDSGYLRWGFEELELARRLEEAGATSTATRRARGRHLKRAELEGFLANFRASVPNLVRLARAHPDDPRIREWLAHRFERPRALEACETLLRELWLRCNQLDAEGCLRAGPAAPAVATALSDAAFALGLARGFQDEYGAKAPEGLELPALDDRQRLLHLGTLLAATYLAGAVADQEPLAQELLLRQMRRAVEQGGFGPELLGDLAGRIDAELRPMLASCR